MGMELRERWEFIKQIATFQGWWWLLVAPFGVLGAFQMVRDEFLSDPVREKLMIPHWFPSWWTWQISAASFLLVCYGLIFEGAYRVQRSPVPIERIALRNFRDMAKEFGWPQQVSAMTAPKEWLDFLDAIRQGAVDGEIELYGRHYRTEFAELGEREPLVRIPTDHWERFQISGWEFIGDHPNFDTSTIREFSSDRGGFERFRDIHIEARSGQRWLKRHKFVEAKES